MFDATNLPLFLSAVLPALGYLLLIYSMGRKLVNLKSAIVFVIFGCLSTLFIQFGWDFIFPHFSDPLFLDTANPVFDVVNMKVWYAPTIFSIIFLAFIQIALKEELVKLGAFLLAALPRRHKVRKERDTLFAIMFYSCCVAVGFAIIENIHYAQNFLSRGSFEDTQFMLVQRNIFAVLSHMIAGLIMGYGIAMASISKGFNKVFFIFSGIFMATMYHGYYDYLFISANSDDFVQIGPMAVHIQAVFIMIFSLVVTFLLGSSLRRYSMRYNKVLRKKERQALVRKNSDSSPL